MSKKSKWFEASKEGLEKVMHRRGGKRFVIFEMWQNVWDQNITKAEMTLSPVKGKPQAELSIVDDDPDGFVDLSHAYTLFAESVKKDNPNKRGRFNLGEKLILACCTKALVVSTKGSIEFMADGSRRSLRRRREVGTEFTATLKVTREEYKEIENAVSMLIPPPDIVCKFNGVQLERRQRIAQFSAYLETEIADDDGYLKPKHQRTDIDIYECLPGETAHIYEMGIPVVETSDKFHLDVQQKVPLNMDRTNVKPSYLRELRAKCLNETAVLLDAEEVARAWVQDALGDYEIKADAFNICQGKQYGEKVVAYDPSDAEANKRAVSEGYTVIHGNSRPKCVWDKAREFGATPSAGSMFPTYDPYSDDPNATVVKVIPKSEQTDHERAVVSFARWLARKIMYVDINVRIVDTANKFKACYGERRLDFNKRNLDEDFFTEALVPVLDLLIHEFGHEYEADHLSSEYYKALTKLGAKATFEAIVSPSKFLYFNNIETWEEEHATYQSN